MDEFQEAVRSLFDAKGPGHCFPSDELWRYVDDEPASGAKPIIIRRLNKAGYIVATGRTTKAVSPDRKGAPTTEYTFGEQVSPESYGLAVKSLPEAGGSSAPKDDSVESGETTVVENKDGAYPLPFPLQRIVHGCPGSGKSYTLKHDAEKAHYVIRTVFHPESSYSDFVGGLRPQSIYRVSNPQPQFVGATVSVPGEPYVHYVVQTGPLLKAYQLASLNPNKSVVLIVEELSRAVAAHVFGDTLQLLDRSETQGDPFEGYSEYEIEPRPDIAAWLTFSEVWNAGTDVGKMRFPPNLYIWATMNRADQNARQLDAAFLRRWHKEYLSYLTAGSYDDVALTYGGAQTTWGKLRGFINEKLKEFDGIPEDKFVGPYMIPKARLVSSDVLYEDLWGYLWNDVLKTRAPSFFTGASTFAEVSKVWNAGNGAPVGALPT